CKGCYLCIEACKKDAISLSDYTNKKGFVTIKVDEEKCIQCGACYTMCPDLVFEIL
ncbi:MAG: 4Fe-4S binding protein, partial [Clostridioides difficile]|nr:4Fe-4S binding protein [Clostridioides difficile]